MSSDPTQTNQTGQQPTDTPISQTQSQEKTILTTAINDVLQTASPADTAALAQAIATTPADATGTPPAQPESINQEPTEPAVADADFEPALEKSAEETRLKAQQDPAFAQSLAPTGDLQNIVIEIEKDLLEEITKNLDSNKITPEEAEKLSKEFIELLPIHDKKDLLEKLTKLNQEHRDLQDIYLKYVKPEEEEQRQKKLELMSHHIKNGNIDQALAVAKGGTNE